MVVQGAPHHRWPSRRHPSHGCAAPLQRAKLPAGTLTNDGYRSGDARPLAPAARLERLRHFYGSLFERVYGNALLMMTTRDKGDPDAQS